MSKPETCPNCGHCPTCGRSNTPPAVVIPWNPSPYYPWTRPYITWHSGTTDNISMNDTIGITYTSAVAS